MSILYYFGDVKVWSARIAGLAWSAPVSLCRPFDAWDARRAARTRTGCGGAYGTRIRTQLYFKCVIVPADGTRAATAGKRRLRYVCVFWAALGQAAAYLYLATWGADPKAQWLVEN
jgi:hypothetical protein